jgi:hypothetical protein
MSYATRLRSAVALVALATLAPAASFAQTTAINLAAGTAGNQSWTGALGIDFNVTQAINVTSLGAFDAGSNGFATAKSVRLYDRTTGLAIASVLLAAGTGTSLDGAYRFASIPSLALSVGFLGSIVADGFNEADLNYNTLGAAFPGTINTSGAFTFVGGSRYDGAAGVYPTITDGGPAVRYGAGSFKYNVVSTVPEPTTWAMMGMGLLGVGGIARRKRSATV